MNSVEKGRVAEAKVVARLAEMGLDVFVPVFGNAFCDLVTLDPVTGYPCRIEVKYTSRVLDSGAVEVALRQVRPNRSGNTVKKFDASKSDLLAVYAFPFDGVAFISSATLDGRSSISLMEEAFTEGQADWRLQAS